MSLSYVVSTFPNAWVKRSVLPLQRRKIERQVFRFLLIIQPRSRMVEGAWLGRMEGLDKKEKKKGEDG